MKREEVEAKALELMSPSLGARARQVVDKVRNLDRMTDVSELIALIAV
jgi:hypothetical protein